MGPDTSIPNKIFLTVDENLRFLKDFFGSGIDLVACKNEILARHTPSGLVYIESIADPEMIRDHLLLPLLNCDQKPDPNADKTLFFIQTRIIAATDIRRTSDMAHIVKQILSGDTALFLENANYALVVGSRKVEKRAVDKPENESTVLGSQESFTDDIVVNTSLILKRLPAPTLRFEEFTVGRLSATKIKLLWLEGIANPEFIREAKKRIQKIDIDHMDGVGILGELIEDKPLSIFPKYRQTERPDVAARNLTDGRFAILCDNSPFAFIAPTALWDHFRSMDDYHEGVVTSSYLRIMRYVAFAFSILISSLYLSFVTYNQTIVPSALALNLAAGRESVPLPTVLELLILTLFITIIREAGVRMPGSVGFFIATLAAIVVGQAIVNAGYVSPSLIIVVAVGTIASFAITSTTLVYPARILNYVFIFSAAFFGIFGVINGLVFLFWYLASLSSFGMPYLYPLIPFDKDGMKDLFIRSRLNVRKRRMKFLSPRNRVRVGEKGIK